VNSWIISAEEAIVDAKQAWIHIAANRAKQEYDYEVALPGNIPPPEWPTEPFDELARLAFRDHTLREGDHPVLRRLRTGA
jgi:hypothetical protein